MSKQKTAMKDAVDEMNIWITQLVDSRETAKDIGNFEQVSAKSIQIFHYENILEKILLPKLNLEKEQMINARKSGLPMPQMWQMSKDENGKKWYNETYGNDGI